MSEVTPIFNELMVRFSSPKKAKAAHAQIGATVLRTSQLLGTQLIRIPEGVSLADAYTFYESALGIETVDIHSTANTFDVNDTRRSEQYGLDKISAPTAWATATGAGVLVALIDTGTLLTHPDLAANIHPTLRYDYGESDSDPSATTSDHGTHTAGIIAAVGNNSQGIAGVAYGAQLVVIKALNAFGALNGFAVIDGIEYATAKRLEGHNIRVINLSLGDMAYSDALRDACLAAEAAGILIVAAAGNSNTDLDTTPNYPACATAGILTVGGTDSADAKYSNSNYGLTQVDIAAPGVGILSTVLSNGYGTKNGTSMAAPHVSGAAALLFQAHPTLTPAQAKAALMDSGDAVASWSGKSVTGKRLNVAAALQSLVTEGESMPVTLNLKDNQDKFFIGGAAKVASTTGMERNGAALIEANTTNQIAYHIEFVVDAATVEIEAHVNTGFNLEFSIDGGANQTLPGDNTKKFFTVATGLAAGKHLIRVNIPQQYYIYQARITGNGETFYSHGFKQVWYKSSNVGLTAGTGTTPLAIYGTRNVLATTFVSNGYGGLTTEFRFDGNGVDVLCTTSQASNTRYWHKQIDGGADEIITFPYISTISNLAHWHPVVTQRSNGTHTAKLIDLDGKILYALRSWRGSSFTTAGIIGDTSIAVSDSSNFAVGDWLQIGRLDTLEIRQVLTVPDGTHITVAALSKAHAIGEAVRNYTGTATNVTAPAVVPTFSEKIVWLGDSILSAHSFSGSQWPGYYSYDPTFGYVYRVALAKGWDFAGIAVQGWTSTQLKTATVTNGDGAKYLVGATKAVIQIGTNDLGSGGNVTGATYQANIEALIAEVQLRATPGNNTPIWLCAVYSPLNITSNATTGETKASLTARLETVAAAQRALGRPVYVVDFATALDKTANASTNLDIPDLVHPSEAGQAKLATSLNATVSDVTAPTLSSAVVNADGTISLTFSEAVNGVSAGAITINVNGTPRTYSVTGSGTTRTLTPTSPIYAGDTVTRTYSGSAITDSSANALAAFTGSAVTNNSTVPVPDVTPPTLTGATLATNGTTLALVFSEAVTGNTGLTVTVDGSGRGYSISGTGANRSLELSSAAYVGQSVLVSYAPGTIVDASSNALAAFSNAVATNNSTVPLPDTTAPTVTSATLATNGTTLQITFSENVTGSSGLTAAVNGTLRSASISGSGTLRTLELSSPAYVGQTVTFSYSGSAITDTAGNPLAAITNAAVTSNSTVPVPDTTAPTLALATLAANGTTLTATFSETVTGSTGLSVSVAGVARSFSITGSGSSRTLELVTPAYVGQTVTMSYSPGTITDTAGNALGSFSGTGVTNNSAVPVPDTTAPVVVSKTLASDGLALTVVFSESVNGTTGLVVRVNGNTRTYAIGGAGNARTLTLTSAASVGDTITLSYAAGDITDSSGNALAGFTNSTVANNSTVPVPDTTKPTLFSAILASNGTSLTVVFSENVTGTTGLTVFVDGSSRSFTVSGSGDSRILELSAAALSGQTVTLTYAGGNIADSSGNTLNAFSSAVVVNNSTVEAPDVSPPPAPTNLLAVAGDGQVTLTWTPSEAADLAGYDVDRNGTVVDAGNTTSLVHSGLDNGTTYTYRVRSRDFTGNVSVWTSYVSATPNGETLEAGTMWATLVTRDAQRTPKPNQTVTFTLQSVVGSGSTFSRSFDAVSDDVGYLRVKVIREATYQVSYNRGTAKLDTRNVSNLSTIEVPNVIGN